MGTAAFAYSDSRCRTFIARAFYRVSAQSAMAGTDPSTSASPATHLGPCAPDRLCSKAASRTASPQCCGEVLSARRRSECQGGGSLLQQRRRSVKREAPPSAGPSSDLKCFGRSASDASAAATVTFGRALSSDVRIRSRTARHHAEVRVDQNARACRWSILPRPRTRRSSTRSRSRPRPRATCATATSSRSAAAGSSARASQPRRARARRR